jgi:DNA-3-methyladenine glycosylase II
VTILLDSDAVLAQGLAALSSLDPVMDRLVGGGAHPPLRKREPGLDGLVSIIVSQQLSTSSAAAIWGRVQAAFPDLTAHALAHATDAVLRDAGLSAPKIRTLRAIAEALEEERLPLGSLHELEADEAHALMTGIRGIGPWTADIYLLFCLGHPDAFPAGDLALQEAARIAYDLDGRPGPAALTELAERWRPWRGVAAYVLWAYYAQVKSRDALPVE